MQSFRAISRMGQRAVLRALIRRQWQDGVRPAAKAVRKQERRRCWIRLGWLTAGAAGLWWWSRK